MTETGYLSQLVDQLERLQLERVTSAPELSTELQEERLQLERAKSAVRPLLRQERYRPDSGADERAWTDVRAASGRAR